MSQTIPLENRAARGSVAGIASLALGMATALIQVPLLLRFWQADEYGVWVSLLATLSLVTVLDAGHQNFVGNEIGKAWGGGDPGKVRLLLGSGLRTALWVALAELGLGATLVFSGKLPVLLGENGGGGEYGAAAAFLLYLVFWTTFGSAGGILARLYAPSGHYARGEWLGVINRGAIFVALVTACLAGADLFGAMAAQVFVGSLFSLFFFIDLRRLLPDLYPWWRGGTAASGLANLRCSLLLTANSLLDQAAGSGLVLVVTAFFSPIQAGLLATLRTLANLAQQGSLIFLNPVGADLARFHGAGEGAKIQGVFSVGWAAGHSLTAAGMIALAPLVGPAYGAWTQGKFVFDAGMFAWLGTAVVLRNWAAPFQLYLASVNSLKSQLGVGLARGVFCLGTSLLLIQPLGIHGVGAGILAGESAGAVAGWLAAGRRLSDHRVKIPRGAALRGLLQVLAVAAALAGLRLEGALSTGITLAALFFVGGITFVQWRQLEPDLRGRIAGMLRTLTS